MAGAIKTVLVTNSSELLAALKKATGGETIVLQNTGTDYQLTASGLKFSSAVKIVSENPDNPANFNTFRLKSSSNIEVDSVRFDATQYDGKAWSEGAGISNSNNIKISNSYFEGGAIGQWGVTEGYVKGENGIGIGGSTNITISNNIFANHSFAVNIHENNNVIFSDNEIKSFQGDGIRMSGNVGVLIENNYIHDPLGADHDVTHNDFIQMWAVDETRASENITIRGNILDSGDGATAQGIFMRNEDVDRGLYGEERYYKNIVIEDNIIRTANTWGINVGEAIGVNVSNNVVVYNAQSGGYEPVIKVNALSKDAVVSDNITNKSGNDVVYGDNNLVINYENKAAPNYIGKIFANLEFGGAVGMQGYSILPGSIAAEMGVGSNLVKFDTTPDKLTPLYTAQMVDGKENVFRFDAGLSANPNGLLNDKNAKFTWDFGDGKTATGKIVTHEFDSHGRVNVKLTVVANGQTESFSAYLNVKDPVILDVDFNDTKISDLSSYAHNIKGSVSNLVTVDGKQVYHIESGKALSVPREIGDFYDLEQFSISFDYKRGESINKDVKIVGIYQSFQLTETKKGELVFSLNDNAGNNVKIKTDPNILGDKWHGIVISYDSIGGKAKLLVDGKILGEAEALAPSKSLQSWGLVFGDGVSHYSANGFVDNIKITTDPYSTDLPKPGQNEPSIPPVVNPGANAGTRPDDYKTPSAPNSDADILQGNDRSNNFKSAFKYDYAAGHGGDDYIRGASVITGGDGNDKLFGTSKGGHELYGDDGNDLLVSYSGGDLLVGGRGADIFKGAGGDDILVVDNADKVIQGGAGNDKVIFLDAGLFETKDKVFSSIESFDMRNGKENTLSLDWKTARAAQDKTMFILADDNDIVVFNNAKGLQITDEGVVNIGQEAFKHYHVDNGSNIVLDYYVSAAANTVDGL